MTSPRKGSTQEEFLKHLETFFRVKSESVDAQLKLIEVRNIQNSDAFSLLFVGPGENFLHQHTYSFDHESMESFDLFIVPVGQRDDGFVYQGIFNTAN
jgi:hypothetical protein